MGVAKWMVDEFIHAVLNPTGSSVHKAELTGLLKLSRITDQINLLSTLQASNLLAAGAGQCWKNNTSGQLEQRCVVSLRASVI